MKKLSFLNKLAKERKLELVEPSKEISGAYIHKSLDCLKSAKILLKNNLYDNSVSQSYYCMYNSLLALLFMCGIKCENHAASIFLLEPIFEEETLSKQIFIAKSERIDKQYYLRATKIEEADESGCEGMVNLAEQFSLNLRVIIEKLSLVQIEDLRNKLKSRVDKIVS